MSPQKQPLDILLTIQVLVFLAIALVRLIMLVWQWFHRQVKDALGLEIAEWSFHIFNLVSIMGASFGLYLVGTGGDYRVIATHFTVSLLLLIYFRHYRVVGLVIVSSLIMLPAFLHDYRRNVITRFPADTSQVRAYNAVYTTHIIYDPAARDAWCNTVLVRVPDYNHYLLDIAPGMGISFFWNTDEKLLTFKSRYLLLRDDIYAEILQRPDAPTLTWVADTPGPTKLYINQSVACHQGQ